MSVNPGFGGQSFIDNTYTKVTNLKKLIAETNSNALIEIDGGVTTANAEKLSRCGADILVAGSSVFRAPSISEAITALHG
jgi:ribulose-phosphate 3-epimerase